ncbi:MAG: hypothetical protein IPK71_25870 [Myxococcales bacterium]|nr:hypothetical protein [Myxococcales bacterium]
MPRDSLFGESIVWSGRPTGRSSPRGSRLVAIGFALASVMSVGFAAVAQLGLHASAGGTIAFAAWCATLALAAWQGPRIYRQKLEYLVTDGHVIVRRGAFRRTIDRHGISYAVIRWSPEAPGTGDLVLVRAVPTGALRRTLTLTLVDVDSPDKLWARIRGVAVATPLGDGERPLAQRLEEGERVLWSGTPVASTWTARRGVSAAIAFVLALVAARAISGSVPAVLKVLKLHALAPAVLVLLVVSVAIGALLTVGMALVVAYGAWIEPARLARATRYFVTNRRVLIRRGNEELSLDRRCIAYVITAPARRHDDLFLVLDGPRARALAASGAFGEGQATGELTPVFSQIEDAETAFSVLQRKGTPSLPPPMSDAA